MSIWSSIGGAVLGGVLGGNSAKKDRSLQREFAQNSIQWRVADAKKAGIHPLYALGNPGISYSPVGDGGSASIAHSMGQDISRSLMANKDARERQAILVEERARQDRAEEREDTIFRQTVAKNELELEAMRSQLARANSGQLGPPSPAPGSVNRVPARVEVGSVDNAGRSPGAITDVQFRHRSDGGLDLAPSEQSKERMEDDIVQQVGWFLRNNVANAVSGPRPPSTREFPVPRGYAWEWDWDRHAFYPRNVVTREWLGRSHPRVSPYRDLRR